MRRLKGSDRGVSLVLVAMSLTVLFGAAALAVDIGAIWLDRSTDQKITDSAASAGALDALTTDGQTACESALAYVAVNANDIPSLDASACATTFTGPCDPLLARSLPPVTSGRYTITVTYPVPNGHRLMTSGIVGAGTQALDPADGDPCERVAVEMTATRDSLFAQVLGFSQGQTTVHSVARAFLPPPDGPPINLLLLDRFGCSVMQASGNGGIIIDQIVDPASGEVFPGEGAVDSNADIGCPADQGTIDVNGSDALIRADGPPGCSNEDPLVPGGGCGILKTFAPGTPGCNWPACTGNGSGSPNPPPTAQAARLTRAPIDHRYNCRSDYSTVPATVFWAADPLTVSNEQDIPGCDGPGGPEIHNLIANVKESGPPNGTFAGPWQRWSSLPEVIALPDPCSVDKDKGFSVNGNVWVDICPLLSIKDPVRVTNGSMVLDGNLVVEGNAGHLIVNNVGNPGFVFMRNGLMRKAGQSSLSLVETMVYVSKSSLIEMKGGSGNLLWIAPDDEDYPFDDLALWSDSTVTSAPHLWEGQADLKMEGVFFVPIVTVEYAGQGEQKQTRAQFIADKLHARGNGTLTVAPIAGRAVNLKSVPQTTLIR
jgi:hypothetical protein